MTGLCAVTGVSRERRTRYAMFVLFQESRSPTKLFILASAGVAGAAALPWMVAALGGGAAFVFDEMAVRASALRAAAHRYYLAGTALIGAGLCCLLWAAGRALSALV